MAIVIQLARYCFLLQLIVIDSSGLVTASSGGFRRWRKGGQHNAPDHTG